MDVPSLSNGVVGSRFVSSDEIEVAKAKREEQWKAAYARLGQEPPPRPAEEVYDGRSLAEKLAANKIAKQEEWEERTKLANQFRALEEDEIMFLDSIRERQEKEERQRKEEEGEEVKSFREAIASRTSSTSIQSLEPPTKTVTPSKPTDGNPVKKEGKRMLKGVVVKKKAKPTATARPKEAKPPSKSDEEPEAKRRKVSSS